MVINLNFRNTFFYRYYNSIYCKQRFIADQDGAEPSSNAVACKNLLILSSCLSCSEYKEKAEKLIKSQKELAKYPSVFPEFTHVILLSVHKLFFYKFQTFIENW